MNQTRTNFLALILLDALEDENESDVLNILEKNENIDPSYVPPERGISPLHYICGMNNEKLAVKFAEIFLEMCENPNVAGTENMTPLHVAAIHGRKEIVRLLLQHGARIDAYDDERKSPVHYAIEECHFEVVQLMRDFIFLDKYERRRQIEQPQTLQVPMHSDHRNESIPSQVRFDLSLQKRMDNKKSSTPIEVEVCNKNLSVAKLTEELTSEKYTPNRVHYNYDVTSPYYINVTHRRNKPQPQFPSLIDHDLSTITIESSPECVTRPLNIFTLTKENLEELSQTNQDKERSRLSLIELWREKVKRSNARRSILREFNDVQEMVQTVMENDHLNFKNTILAENLDSADSGACGTAPTSSNEHLETQERLNQKANMSLGTLIQRVAQAHLPSHELEPPSVLKQMQHRLKPANMPHDTDSSYHTVPEIMSEIKDKSEQNSSNFIRSPNAADYYLQMTEAYVHTDDENGLVFYETKLLCNQGNRMALQRCEGNGNKQTAKKPPPNVDTTMTSQSTDFTIPVDYETDALRAELTTFGEPPGPITKSTKRLYIKRLIKCKRKTNRELQQSNSKGPTENKIKFSVELYRSIRSLESFERIVDYMKYDVLSTEFFANHQNKHKMREGHLKQSFIYMLIDPRISCNLPGESIYMEKFDAWKRFLESIFYVGKGKTSRPYSHLYDAMKLHSRLHNAAEKDALQKNGKKISIKKQQINMELFKTKTTQALKDSQHSKKLQRILDVWANNQGVVCLHVFHNIMPTEAYTREAAIIDALGLTHLTNVKRGDYYGPAKTWTMKEKKFFGIALLYKAMKIYLAEGESQLSPSDLI